MNNSPIGIVDSGSGGLSIYQSVRNLMPKESFIYIGDHKYVPYGAKSTQFIKDRVGKLILYLISQHVKLVIIACNTATIAGVDYFRQRFPEVPIVGVVPVIKTAAKETKTKHIIVLSTSFTAKSDYQRKLIHMFAPDCEVKSLGSSELVPLIEGGHTDDDTIKRELQVLFHRTQGTPFDVVVLGCTHYPFVRNAIGAIVGNGVKILDSGDAVARQVHRILFNRNELAERIDPDKKFMTTGDPDNVKKVFKQLLNQRVNVSYVAI